MIAVLLLCNALMLFSMVILALQVIIWSYNGHWIDGDIASILIVGEQLRYHTAHEIAQAIINNPSGFRGAHNDGLYELTSGIGWKGVGIIARFLIDIHIVVVTFILYVLAVIFSDAMER